MIPYSGSYLQGPNFCKICEVFMSSQIFNSEATFLFSYNTVNINVLRTVLSKLHTSPITLHVATAKGSWQFFRVSQRESRR